MFVHASDGAEHGMNKILLRTVDTDVLVIGFSRRLHTVHISTDSACIRTEHLSGRRIRV